MGRRRIADTDRKANPGQRPSSRAQRADPLVFGPRRYARRLGQRRHFAWRSGLRSRPEQLDRVGTDDRGIERSGPFHRNRRSGRPVEISQPGRTEAVRDARRDYSCEKQRGCEAYDPRDPAWSSSLRRQHGSGGLRRAGKGGRARLYRARRARYDRRSLHAHQFRAELGRISRCATPLSDPELKTSSLPIPAAISVS